MIDSTEQTHAIIEKFSKEMNSFRLRLLKGKSENDLSMMLIAIFDGVEVRQIQDLELWLPVFAGGGYFKVEVYHTPSLSTRLGSALRIRVAGPDAREVNRQVLGAVEWNGPRNMSGPASAVQDQLIQVQGATLPAAPGAPPVSKDPLSAEAERFMREARAQGQAQVDAIRATSLLSESERRITDVSRREAELARKEADLASEARSLRHADTSGGNNTMMEFFKMMAAERSAADERARQDRQASEDRARQAQERSDERFRQTLELLNKPNPVNDALIQKALHGKDDVGEQLQKLSIAQSSMMNQIMGSTMQLLQTKIEMAQMESGDQDSPMFRLAGRGIDLVEKLMESKDEKHDEDQGNGHSMDDDDDVEDAQVVDGNAFGKFDAAVFAMQAPAVCIPLFFEVVRTKEFEAIFNAAKGELEQIATERYGAWAVKDLARRQRYLHVVLPRCFQAAVIAGLIEEAPKGGATTAHAATAAAPKRQASARAAAPAVRAAPEPAAQPETEAAAAPPQAPVPTTKQKARRNGTAAAPPVAVVEDAQIVEHKTETAPEA